MAMLCTPADDGFNSPRSWEFPITCAVAHQAVLVNGLQMYVQVESHQRQELIASLVVTGFGETVYLVITLQPKPGKTIQRGDNACRAWQRRLNDGICRDQQTLTFRLLSTFARVGEGADFTRLSQRRFGCGDIVPTRMDVEEPTRGGGGG